MRESDKRRFRSRLSALYPLLGDEQLSELIPKGEALIVSKLKSRDELISGRDPMFFTHRDTSFVKGGGEELLPSVYSLRIAPQALCKLVLVAPGLEKQVPNC